MKLNKFISLFLITALVLGVLPFTIFAEAADPLAALGGGNEEDPYIIDSVEDWQTVSALTDYTNVGKYFKLGADIGAETGEPTALRALFSKGFTGLNLNGNNKTIQNVTFTTSLIANEATTASIYDLTVKNAFYNGDGTNGYGAILVGLAKGVSVFTDVTVEGSTVSAKTSMGILAGEVSWGELTATNCCVVGCTVKKPHTGWQEGMGAFVGKIYGSAATFNTCTLDGIALVDKNGAEYSDDRVGTIVGNINLGGSNKATKFIGCVIDCKNADISAKKKIGTGSVAELDIAVINIPGVTDPFASLGKGTAIEPYIIDSVEDWELIHNTESYLGAGSRFKLGADIGSPDGAPITLGALFTKSFDGLRLDGNGKTIQNVSFTDSALIAPTSSNCQISNLTVKNANFAGSGQNYGAILIGKAAGNTVITGVTVESSLAGAVTSKGILIGEVSYGNATVTDCSVVDCTVKHTSGWSEGMGALVGKINQSTATFTSCTVTNIAIVGKAYTETRIGSVVGNIASSNVYFNGCVLDCSTDTSGVSAKMALIGMGSAKEMGITVKNSRHINFQTTAPDENGNFKMRCFVYFTEAERDAEFKVSITKNSEGFVEGGCQTLQYLWGYEGNVQCLYDPESYGGVGFRYFTADATAEEVTYDIEIRYEVNGVTYLNQGVARMSATGLLVR